MNYKLLLGVAIVVIVFLGFLFNISLRKPEGPVPGSLYDLTMRGLDGSEIPLSMYRGRKLLLVNTASKCGKTPQYAGLQNLHERFGEKVIILGFPANNFLWQEPGSNQEIAEFCRDNYGVGFQMFEKISVKGGDQHPLYQWLEARTGHRPDWNFAKYLVNEDGTEVVFFKSSVEPLDEKILSKL